MANFVESKEMTITKIKAAAKAEIMDYIEECLISKYGEGNVGYVREGNGQSKTKVLAVRIGNVEVGDESYEQCVCVNGSGKDYREHTSDKGKVYVPFQFNVLREEYEIYLEEKAAKAADAATKKSKKIAKDTEARAKKSEASDLMDF